MSTNIPPHNLGEVCDALCYLIDNYERREDVTVEDLMKFIPGPDFPTGGVVFRYGAPGQEGEREDLIAQAYASGRGQRDDAGPGAHRGDEPQPQPRSS